MNTYGKGCCWFHYCQENNCSLFLWYALMHLLECWRDSSWVTEILMVWMFQRKFLLSLYVILLYYLLKLIWRCMEQLHLNSFYMLMSICPKYFNLKMEYVCLWQFCVFFLIFIYLSCSNKLLVVLLFLINALISQFSLYYNLSFNLKAILIEPLYMKLVGDTSACCTKKVMITLHQFS